MATGRPGWMYPVMNSLGTYQSLLLQAMIKQVMELEDSRKDVKSNLDTGHTLDDADWDKPDDGDDDGYEETPPMHVRRVP